MATKRSGAQRRSQRKDKLAILKDTGAFVRSCVPRDIEIFLRYCKTEHTTLVQPSGDWVVDGDIARRLVSRVGHLRNTKGFEPLIARAQGSGIEKSQPSSGLRRIHKTGMEINLYEQGTLTDDKVPRTYNPVQLQADYWKGF